MHPRTTLSLTQLETREMPASMLVGDPGQTRDTAYRVASLSGKAQVFDGGIERTSDVDLFAVDVRIGQRLRIGLDDDWNKMTGAARAGAQTQVQVWTADGRPVVGAGPNGDLVLNTATQNARLFVGVSHAGNSKYRITDGSGTVAPRDASTGTYTLALSDDNAGGPSRPPVNRRFQPGVYVAGRDMNFHGGIIGTHQYLILVPENASSFAGVRGLGDGSQGVVIGAHQEAGRLVVRRFETADFNATIQYANPALQPWPSPISNFHPTVEKVSLGGRGIDDAIGAVLRAGDYYEQYTRTRPIPYPSGWQMVMGEGVNSNSWAQSIVRHIIGPNRVRTNFPGNDLLWDKIIPPQYFSNTSRGRDEVPQVSVPDPLRLTAGRSYAFASANFPDRAIRHRDFEAWLDQRDASELFAPDSGFVARPGLADPSLVSFESVNFPGRFLRHREMLIHLDANDGSELYKFDATFRVVPGLNGTGVSFESANFPGYFIRHEHFRPKIAANNGSELFRNDASFSATAAIPAVTNTALTSPASLSAVVTPPSSAVQVRVPAASAAPTVTNVWARAADLNWERVPNADWVKVYRSADGANFAEVGAVRGYQTRFLSEGLRPGTTYWFRLQAVNQFSISPFSDTISLTTKREAPVAPSGLVAANVWATRVDLAWADRSDDESGFVVQVSSDGKTFREVGRTGANTTRFRVEQLRSNTRYWFRVLAINEIEASRSTDFIVTTKR